ncbi:precorrin-3B C(17)-methyltransferase [Metapseudomonas resinovorans]|uniref:Precorrin-3B C17-methyltransferase n=1 Tax=Metapseudomonas resinovorans NBRC 106553 TaxID=1245471 RepID=S6ALT4_METRE|nr:precorrin-3B C(17)-methyltransferase [Pseudomonas resinovorans]BAN46373.1 precorrin-3B C17-methyltransferase [Pseudomonas resinovorans NBRC 106553]
MEQPNAPAIVLLGNGGLATARRVQALYPQARVLGLAGRVEGADECYAEFGETLRELYRSDTPIIGLCAAGILIRALAPLLASKGAEPPVLALAEDGSAVVPLLGGLGGVNRMAREIAATLNVAPAITTSGELRFGTCLLDPPAGYALADIEQGKRFVSDLLGGEAVRVEGDAPWLAAVSLPLADEAQRVIHITAEARPAQRDELLIHPRAAVARIIGKASAEAIRQALADAGLAPLSLACLLATRERMVDGQLAATATELGVPLRFGADESALPPLLREADGIAIHLADAPLEPATIGQPRGRLTVIGLGPGAAEFMVPAARQALDEAQDLLGYETYIRMAGPLRPDQVAHCTDNREELQRARHAFELAASGRRVVVVSSGDPGVFAMAAAVLEALDDARDPEWLRVELQVFPGVSAALATAAKAGAPLGHDFCLLSLSDNLKPWDVIEKRLDHAGAADLAMAFYNPISRSRPWQLGRALEIVRRHRAPETLVVLGRDIGRPAERLSITSLGELTPEQVDMRTLVIIGSSLTRRVPRGNGEDWVYTPRWYR